VSRHIGVKVALVPGVLTSNGSQRSMSVEIRRASLERNTNETQIQVSIALDTHPEYAPQVIKISTGIGFLDHVRCFCDACNERVRTC